MRVYDSNGVLKITGGAAGASAGIAAISAAGNSVSNGTVVFSNSPTVTFGMAGSTVTASAAGGGGGAVTFSGGTSSAALSSLVFSDLSGIRWGLNGSTMTANATASISATGNTIATNSVSMTANLSAFVFAASGTGVSVGVSNGSIVMSGNALTSQTVQTQNAISVQGSTGDIRFADSNGVDWGFNASTITAQVTGNASATGNTIATNSVSMSMQVSAPIFAASGTGLSVGVSNGSVVFSANALTAQTNQTLGLYFTSNTTQSSSGTQDARSLTFHGAGVASVGYSNGSVVVSVPAGGGAGDGVNIIAAGTRTATTAGTVLFSNANGVTFGLNAVDGSILTASVREDWLSTQSNQALSGSNGSFAFQTATFGNLNGMSFYTSNGSMVGSYTVPTVTNSSMTVSDAATSGTLAQLAFTNLNGVTLSLSTGANGSHTIVGSHNALTQQSNQTGKAYVTGANSHPDYQTTGNLSYSSLAVSGRGGLSVGYTAGTMVLEDRSTGSFSAVNNSTVNETGTYSPRTIYVSGAGIASVGINAGTLIVSVPAAAADGVNVIAAGTQTAATTGTIVFSDSNGVSFGMSGSTRVTANISQATLSNSNNVSFGAAAGVITATATFPSLVVSYGGNTTGSTQTLSSGTVVLAGGLGIRLSGSTAAGAQTISVYHEPCSSIIPNSWHNTGTGVLSIGTNTSATATFLYMPIAAPVLAGWLGVVHSMSFITYSNSNASQSLSYHFGLYTRGTGTNSTILSRLTSNSLSIGLSVNNSSYTISQPTSSGSIAYTYSTTASAGVNISSGYTGLKMIHMPFGTTLSQGDYWLGVIAMNSSSSNSGGLRLSIYGNANSLTGIAPIGSFSSAWTTGSNVGPMLGGNPRLEGIWTSAGLNTLPASIAISSMTNDNSIIPYAVLWSTS